jgi:hypothetical protein
LPDVYLGAVRVGGVERLAVYDRGSGCLRPVDDYASSLFETATSFYTTLPLSLKLLDRIVESAGGECVGLDRVTPPPLRPRVVWGLGGAMLHTQGRWGWRLG